MAFDAIIIGAGPAGLATALSLDAIGLRIMVVERASEASLRDAAFDGREIALTHHSVSVLRQSGAWGRIADVAISPLREARVETGRANHPLTFDTNGRGVEALGFLVANHLIRQALFATAAARPGIVLRAGALVGRVRGDERQATVNIDGENIEASLVIAADGRFSRVREQSGIGAIVHDFHRSMLVCRMAHESPHHHIATQWFDKGQTVALLPVNGGASSLVLTLPTPEIERLNTLDRDVFNDEIMKRVGNRLGRMRLISTRHVYPLKAVFAHRFAARRLALVGDAAVGMHPITAHGFNLGLRGQETLAQTISTSTDPGARVALRRFEQRHRLASAPLFAATNGIATVYTRDEEPVLKLREIGLRLADTLRPFKSSVTEMLMDRKVEPRS